MGALVDRDHDALGGAAIRPAPPVKPLIDLPRMGNLALKMLHEALDAFTSVTEPKLERRKHFGIPPV